MVLSFLFLVTAVYSLRQWASRRWLFWLVSACALSVVALSGLEYCVNLITGTGINGAVFYHLMTGLEGGDVSQYLLPGIAALGVLGGAVGLLWWFRNHLEPKASTSRRWVDAAVALLAVCAVLSHPASVATASHSLRFSLVAQQQDGFHVVTPDLEAPDRPKNLVLIYLESVERTYLDADRFPGLTPNLNALEQRAITFADVGQTTGAGFTIGAMVASQCGVPLIMPGGANSMRVNQFLSGATCFGDILSEAGYTMSYLGGASLEFAGKGAFYETHGYDEVIGLTELLPTLPDPNYVAEWGLQDDTLFGLAQSRFEDLSAQENPFTLALLTLDTHHPNGHAETNRACRDDPYGDGKNPMLNSVKCADALVGAFVETLLSGPHGQDTVIALVSDHLAMVNSATAQLESGPRRNLFMVLDGAAPTQHDYIDRPATTLDIGPTLLSMLGFAVNKMGFGVDLLGEAPTLPETLGVEADDGSALDSFVMGFRDVYTRLWAFPGISDGLYANIERGEIQFGHHAFRTPALLAFDSENTIDHAVLGDLRADETLSEAALGLPEGKRYAWFDVCAAFSEASNTSTPVKDGLCLLSAQRGSPTKLREISRSSFFSEDELARVLSETSEGVTDTVTLTRIGQRLGDLPLNIEVPGLITGERGVLLQSSAFGAGASLLRRQTTASLKGGEDWILERGVSLIGLEPDGRAVVLDRLDQCSATFDASKHQPWAARIAESDGRFAAHIIAVHDTAFCGNTIEPLNQILEGLPLTELSSSKMREAYLGVITAQGAVFEMPNRVFKRVRVLLRPDTAGEDKLSATARLQKSVYPNGDEDRLADKAVSEPQQNARAGQRNTPVVLASLSTTPLAAGTLSTVETAGCLLPTPKDLTPSVSALKLGARYTQTQLHAQIGFLSGWWGEEGAGRWSGARRSTLRLALPAGDAPVQLELQLASAGGTTRDLSLVYRDETIGTVSVSGTRSFAFDVSDLPRSTPIDLDLIAGGPALTCPKARGNSADPRQLAFMLKSVAVVGSSDLIQGEDTSEDRIEGRYQIETPRPFSHAIAHGGGRYIGTAISNSFEAIRQNSPRFKVIELDFNWTSDGELVCLHDWADSFRARFGAEAFGPVTHARFRTLLGESAERPRNCDLDGLAGWLRASPDIRIVTDAKERPVEAHKLIVQRHPDILDQIIPQAYQPSEIELYRSLGFQSVIWTLYKFGSDPEAVVAGALRYAPSAITMPVSMAQAGLLSAVRERADIPVYVHTVNDPKIAGCLLQSGASGIYSDDLGEADAVALRTAANACE